MSEQKRQRIGLIGVVAGFVLLAVGVLIAHFTHLPTHDALGRELYPFIPRCTFLESDPATCWILPTLGQSIAFVGSQLAIAGIVFGWIYGRRLTWALATVAAFLFTLEMIVLFGIVPNQFLGLAQGTLDWSDQKVFLTIPKWLVLNNNVSISYAALKDMISAGYATTLLAAIAVGAYQLQERAKKAGQPAPEVLSTYGRPVVKGRK